MLLKILQFYGVFENMTPMGPLFVTKHKLLRCVCSIIMYMFQKVCVFFYDVFECFITLGQTKTYFFSKNIFFTMHCEQFFKNISFYNKL